MHIKKFRIIVLALLCAAVLPAQDQHCNEADLSLDKGPSPYGPRLLTPPDHDLPVDPPPYPVHPGVQLNVWHQAGDNFWVGGMSMLPDGSMLELDYDGKVYHVSGLDSPETVTRRAAGASGHPEALGFFMRNQSEVYVLDKERLWLYTWDGTNLTDEIEVLVVPARNGWYGWNGDLGSDGEYLYVTFGRGGNISRYHFDTGAWDLDFGVAMRNSHGMGVSPVGDVWFSDNQGNYRPASPIFLLEEGREYGVPTNDWTVGGAHWQFNQGPVPEDLSTFQSNMVWAPYPEISRSATDIHFMKNGPFRGQALVGDNRTGHLMRFIPDTAGGQQQGTVMRMTGGLEAGTYRIEEDDEGTFYLGGLGTAGSTGYWHWCKKNYGFQKMTFDAGFIGSTEFNDIYTVKLVNGGVVVEFTSDISEAFLYPESYSAYTFNYIQSLVEFTSNYGAPKSDSTPAFITGVEQLNNRALMITIDGLPEQTIIALEFGEALTGGENLQSERIFYTLHQHSDRNPSDVVATGNLPGPRTILQTSISGGVLSITGVDQGARVSLSDVSGRVFDHPFRLSGVGLAADISRVPGGIYFIQVDNGTHKQSKFIVIK